MKDFYYILGTDADCTLLEIKEAYKKLAKKFHPDLNQGDRYFESHFKEIQEAYETLSDPRKRSQYDKALKNSKVNPSGGEQKRQYSYSEQAANQQHKYRSASAKPIKRGPGVGMSIVLIVAALIVGAYTIEWLTSSKKKTIVSASPDNVVAVKTHKHHKKKHHLSSSSTDSNQSEASNKVANVPFNPVPVKPAVIKPIVIKPAISNVTSVSNKIPNTSGTSYTTYIHPNATGVVNMRRFDNYSSDVIERIPANSRVLVMEKGNMYYKVSYNNAVGYVPKWAIEVK